MRCPYCDNEMVHGRVENASGENMFGIFQRDGEKLGMKALFENSIEVNILAGSKVDASYCEHCKKVILMANAE